jgi:hypothetical protein
LAFRKAPACRFQSLAERLSSTSSRASPRKRRQPPESRKGRRQSRRRGESCTRRRKPLLVSSRGATTPSRGCWTGVRNRASTGAPHVAQTDNAVTDHKPSRISVPLPLTPRPPHFEVTKRFRERMRPPSPDEQSSQSSLILPRRFRGTYLGFNPTGY